MSPTVLAATAVGITAAGAGAQYIGGRQSAKAQAKHNEQLVAERDKQISENYRNAIASYRLESQGALNRLAEVQQINREKAFGVRVAAARAGATATAQAAGRGSAGGSIMSAIMGIMGAAGMDISGLMLQDRFAESQTELNLRGIHEQAKQRASSLKPYLAPPTMMPGLLIPVSQVAGSGLDAYASFIRPTQQAQGATTLGTSGVPSPGLGTG